MSIFAIGDLHLSCAVEKPMDIFGGAWVNYVEKISNQWARNVKTSDTVVLAGDISWGISLEESLEDFRFIERLPGKKLIIKGNHDYFWTTITKMKRFLADNNVSSIDFLYNNSFLTEGISLCGTRGWFYEENGSDKIYRRELCRLEASLSSAPDGTERVAFLHYPPLTSKGYECPDIIALLHKYGVKRCYYGHLHGRAHRELAVTGLRDGIDYRLIAADYVGFSPVRIV